MALFNDTLVATHRKFSIYSGMLDVSDYPSGHLTSTFRQTPAIDWKFVLKAGHWQRIAEVPVGLKLSGLQL